MPFVDKEDFMTTRNKILFFTVFGVVFILSYLFLVPQIFPKGELVDVKTSDIQSMIDKKQDGFIYIGRPSCIHCKKFLPHLKDSIKDNKIIVNYYNTDENNNEDNLKKSFLLSELNISKVPVVLYVKNGKEVGRFLGNENQTELDEWIKSMKKK
ncbi:thioredoxin [Bacillus anthracis]|nr:thioredoxin [Bacillus anthracis]